MQILRFKKYHGHRCLPASWFADVSADYERAFEEKASLGLPSPSSPSSEVPKPPAQPELQSKRKNRKLVTTYIARVQKKSRTGK